MAIRRHTDPRHEKPDPAQAVNFSRLHASDPSEPPEKGPFMTAIQHVTPRDLWCRLLPVLILAAMARPAGAVVTTADLGGPRRFLTHVSTDKPIYRGGENVYVRGVILDAAAHTPLPANEQPGAMVEITGPRGDRVASGHARAEASVVAFTWTVPPGAAGGPHTVKITYPGAGHAPAERQFDVRAYRAPRLKTQILFLRDGYGPGDEIVASLHVERAEGGVPEGAAVTATARVDGAVVHRGPVTVDGGGDGICRFRLPDDIARGEGTLSFAIMDGGSLETAAKTIPILLQSIDVQFYPEGGELVADLPGRVYFEARTPARKPADLAGVVVDEAGREVARVRTEHEGRGRFSFTPRAGGRYALKVTEPAGIGVAVPLPEVRPEGAVLRALGDVTPRNGPVRLQVAATSSPVTVTLARREVQLASAKVKASRGQRVEVALAAPADADGVLVATVRDAEGRPLAERLVYREPARAVHVTVSADASSGVPGDVVSVTVQTRDEHGAPVAATVGLVATDDSVLEMVETREQAPRLPVMVLLESDVRELADAHVYLDSANPDAPRALDLLLGTQGWRRFAFVDTAKFIAAHGDAARRVLALRMATRREIERLAVRRRGGRLPMPMMAMAAPVAADGPVDEAGIAGVDADFRVDGDAISELGAIVAEGRADLGRALEQAEVVAGEAMLFDRRAQAAKRAPVANDMVAVRVYAHSARPQRQPGDRVDFTETLYWHAGLDTDAETGRATVSFALSDSVTSFRVLADAFTAGGALGAGDMLIDSVEPFQVEPKMPLAVTAGDRIDLPVAVVNATDSDLGTALLSVSGPPGLEITTAGGEDFALDAGARLRRMVAIDTTDFVGSAALVVTGAAGGYGDRVTRPLEVAPRGFPVELAHGGVLEPGGRVAWDVRIPAGVVAGSLRCDAAVYPTPLANMTEALQRLIREPHGCFEQTSSTTYPLVMAQRYFLTHTGVDAALIERSSTMLKRGYERLVSFECPTRGYEWFGADPGHEALTAYGVLEFTDMARVHTVDAAMLERARRWLLDRRDGRGGFQRNAKALDSFGGAPQATTDAYITWALLEAGADGLDKEVDAVRKMAADADDSYVQALAANVLLTSGDRAGAGRLMSRLAARQTGDGYVDGAVTSITRSGGEALRVETTALAVLAWLRDPDHTPSVQRAMHWLAESCQAGRYGSTQSTVLALRAIVAYDEARARPKAPGSVRLFVDGEGMGDAVAFDAESHGAIRLPDVASNLGPGAHRIELAMADGSAMPFAVSIGYHDVSPASSPECALDLKVALRDPEVEEGLVTEAVVTVRNLTEEPVPMPVAIIGLPGGLEVRHDQLKELVKSGRIAAYEVLGRELVLYWRQLKAQAAAELPVSLVAAVPGRYTAPASRAYLYYTDELKCWVEPLVVSIVAGGEGTEARRR